MTLTMYDSTDVTHLPEGAPAYAGYTSGKWPTWVALKARFPHAHLLSIAIDAAEHALCLDVETGDATPAQVPAWVKTEHGRGVGRPVVYASASRMSNVLAELTTAGIDRGQVRLWSAHYGWRSVLHPAGRHICGPHTCGLTAVEMDGTQWRDNAPGENGAVIDESLLNDNFFPPPAPPPVKTLDGYLVTPGAAGGYTGRAIQSHDGGKTWA
jgi:hypothetical protein